LCVTSDLRGGRPCHAACLHMQPQRRPSDASIARCAAQAVDRCTAMWSTLQRRIRVCIGALLVGHIQGRPLRPLLLLLLLPAIPWCRRCRLLVVHAWRGCLLGRRLRAIPWSRGWLPISARRLRGRLGVAVSAIASRRWRCLLRRVLLILLLWLQWCRHRRGAGCGGQPG
jgi:hypothetical protein